MPKNIVLLSDGTGNSAGKLFKTNVWRLYQALDLSEPAAGSTQPKQIAYYDDGVGTSSVKPLAIMGGAFGWGLKRNVLDIYRFLCLNYEPGDRIYAFGFSRGAFTIRVLIGLITNQGLVQANNASSLKRMAIQAFRDYRGERYKTVFRIERPMRAIRDSVLPRVVMPNVADRPKPSIAFLGLWDTVAAYGLPIDELTRAFNAVFPLSTPDRNLSDIVERACHALALDDERDTFHPVLWNEANENTSKSSNHIKTERISQVWFTGVHSNVGGGYADDKLAYVTLNWMAQEAIRSDLRCKWTDLAMIEAAADVAGKLYNSRHGVSSFYRYLPRKLATLTRDTVAKNNQVIIERPKIHQSVFDRIATGCDGHAPINLPAHYAVVTNDGSIVDTITSSGASPRAAANVNYQPLEHTTQSQRRASEQETVWNLVWWRRVTYFLRVGVASLILLFPLLFAATHSCSGRFCALIPILNGASSVLPGFLAPWFESFKSHPPTLLALILAFAVLAYVGLSQRSRIADQMRELWKPAIDNPGAPCSGPFHPPNDWLYKFRTHSLYQAFFKLTKRAILPTLFGIIAVYLILAAIGQGLFAMMNAGGVVCHTNTAKPIATSTELAGSFAFSTNALCHPSGWKVEKGRHYKMTFTLNSPQQWKDGGPVNSGGNSGGILADFSGITADKVSLPMRIFTPFRRHLNALWFQPIVRIGAHGTTEYPLEVTPVERTPQKQIWESTITAAHDGLLYLFVNDAVLPVPSSWQVFYANNSGDVSVVVEKIR